MLNMRLKPCVEDSDLSSIVPACKEVLAMFGAELETLTTLHLSCLLSVFLQQSGRWIYAKAAPIREGAREQHCRCVAQGTRINCQCIRSTNDRLHHAHMEYVLLNDSPGEMYFTRVTLTAAASIVCNLALFHKLQHVAQQGSYRLEGVHHQ